MSTANFFQIKYQGINLPSNTTSVAASAGDIAYNSATSKFDIFTTASDNLVTEITTQTLTNKTINASSNTISNITNANLSGTAAISNANLAAMSANTVKANITGSSNPPSDVALGTVTEATSSVLTLSGWADATIGSPTIQVKQANTSQSGYLSSTDWNTFNSKQSTGNYATSGSGDVSWAAPSGAGPVTTSLVATTNATLATLSALTSVGTITTGTWNATNVAIAHGGTGQSTASAAFNALSPITTTGDMIYSASGATNSRLPIGATNQVLATIGGVPTWSNISSLPIPQGTKNYLSQYAASNGGGALNPGNGNFELGSTTGWSLAHSALSGVLPTSVASAGNAFSSSSGGSAASANLSFSTVSSGQLSGSYSGNLASSAASVAGDMLISNAFYIDTEDQAKVQTVKLYYTPHSGASNLNFSGTSSNSFAVWIYDVTNAAWIMPAGVYNLVQNSGAGYVTATFQTTSNSTQYQLALININASSGAYSLYVDDFFVGPQTAPSGPAMSDWMAYTPTFTGFGTVSNVNVFSRRVGDSLEINGYFVTGTPTGVNVAISVGFNGINSNVTSDPNKIPTGGQVCGAGSFSTANAYGLYPIVTPNSGTFGFGIQSSSAGGTNFITGSGGFGTGETIEFFAKIPIAGWSSNTSMSSDTDTRVVAMDAVKSGGSVTVGSNIGSWTVVNQDTHATFNSSTGVYTVPISGDYHIDAQLSQSSGTPLINLVVNGTTVVQTQVYADGATSLNKLLTGLTAGTTISIQPYASGTVVTSTNPYYTWLSIYRLSGPAVVAATESVNASYYVSTATAFNSTQINFDTKEFDSHNATTTGASWKYTAPVSGTYQVNTTFLANTAPNVDIILYKNGASYKAIFSINSTLRTSGSTLVRLNAGDYIDLRTDGTVTAVGGTSPISTFVSIYRTGN